VPTGQTASEGACAPQSNGKPTRVDSGNTDGSGVARGATKEYFETRPPPSIHGWGTPRRPGRLCGWLTPPPVCAGRRLGDPPLMVLVHHNPMENLRELTLVIRTHPAPWKVVWVADPPSNVCRAPSWRPPPEGACAPPSNRKPARVDCANMDSFAVARGATKEYFETRPPPSTHAGGPPRRPRRLCGWLNPPLGCPGRRLGDPPLKVRVYHIPMENLRELTLAIWTPRRHILDHNPTHSRHSGGLPRPLSVDLMGICLSVSLLPNDKPLTATPMFSYLKTLCGKPESGTRHM